MCSTSTGGRFNLQPRASVELQDTPRRGFVHRHRPAGSETLPKVGVIVHVRIDGVQLKNCKGGPAPTTIEHAPFTKIAIDKSVGRQLRTCSQNCPTLRQATRTGSHTVAAFIPLAWPKW